MYFYLVILKFVMHSLGLKLKENKSKHSEKPPSHFLPTGPQCYWSGFPSRDILLEYKQNIVIYVFLYR